MGLYRLHSNSELRRELEDGEFRQDRPPSNQVSIGKIVKNSAPQLLMGLSKRTMRKA